MRSLQGLRIPVLVAIAIGTAPAPGQAMMYDDLLSLFADWRSFQKPKLAGGVPDYTPAAMEAQRRALAGYRKRLAAIETAGWTVPQKVDAQVVRAEMNGLDFDHRVLQPWARNPAFYVTVVADESDQPAREGPFAYGTVELFRWRFPLTETQADELAARLAPIPALLRQARGNLTGNARDLWRLGIRALEQQQNVLAQLRPYTWAGELTLAQRELARATAALALEEHRNRGLPPQAPVASAEEHQRRFSDGVTEYMAFLAQRDVLTIQPDMDAALRARVGQYTETRPLEFFTEVDYRDPVLMRTHGYHWFDLARMQRQPHPSPIRRGALLYNIFDSRTEGLATAMEELMMQAGLCDTRPRSRELVYILLAQRAARGIGDLRMHANQWSIEQAARFASSNTPRGWLRLEGETVWFEQHLYLQQPGYGTSYVIGKLEIDELIAARRRALGADFTLRRFMDELDAAGLIPFSLLRSEPTGRLAASPGP